MKKLLLFFLMFPLLASAATAVPWQTSNPSNIWISPGLVNGSAQGILVNASSTINNTLSVSSLISGDCVQASTGGLLISAAAACGSGGGSSFAYPFPSNATSTILNFSNGVQVAALSGFVGGNGGTLYSFASSSITTLSGLSLPYSQLTGVPTFDTFAYPFPGNATSTNITFSGGLTGALTGNASTATALATGRTISITGDLAYTSPSFDGSGNITAAGTLATVNSNVGTFTYPSVTVNGKGLITAISNETAPTTYTGTFPINVSGSSITFGGLSTSSAAVLGNIPYFTGVNTFGNIATSTLSASSPLTGSFTQLGSGGSLGCQTASGSQAGCLSSADWTTFNNKGSGTVTAVTGSYPIVSSGGTTPSITFQGLATTSPWTSGSLAYVSNGNTLTSVATTTVSCSGTTSCSPFTVIGSSPVTISSSGGGGSGVGTIATSSSETRGQIPYFTTTAGYPALVGSVATSSITNGSGIAFSATPGALIGGSNFSISASGLTTSNFTSANVSQWTNDANYLTANQSITLSGAVTGSGATSIATTFGNASAGTVLDNPTGSTGTPAFNATSTLFGTGIGGYILGWNNGKAQWIATSSINNGVTSVAASVPSFLSISGSPITTSGTLAISYSGTALPVANGGTGETTAFTAGSVVFAGASGTYTQDNADFFWDNTNKKLGLSSTTPWGQLAINPLAALGGAPAFAIGSSTNQGGSLAFFPQNLGAIFSVQASTTNNPVLFSVDQYGHEVASSTGATPAISSCGTGSPAMGVSANDVAGTFTTGTSASACTITFAQAYATTPVVVISDSNTTAVADISSVSTTAFTISLASALSAVTVYYIVMQP